MLSFTNIKRYRSQGSSGEYYTRERQIKREKLTRKSNQFIGKG